MPAATVKSLTDGSFFGDFSVFLSDRAPFRDFYVGVNSYTNLALGRNSLNNVYFARDGYLINSPEDDGIENFEKNIDKFESFSRLVNVPSELIIVPRAGYVLDDKLPLLSKVYNEETLLKKAEIKTEFVKFNDITSVLKNKDKQVYYKTDHHLTTYGNYLIYSNFSENEPGNYEKEVFDGFYGTTYSSSGFWLTKPDNIEIWYDGGEYTVTVFDGNEEKSYNSMYFKEHLEKSDKYPVYLNGNQPLVKIKNNNGGKGNLLIIKDSYAQALAPFLARDYENTYLIDMRYYRMPVSKFIKENEVDKILYIYGIGTLLTDTSSSWLM